MNALTICRIDRRAMIARTDEYDINGVRWLEDRPAVDAFAEEMTAAGHTRFAPLLEWARNRFGAIVVMPTGALMQAGVPDWDSNTVVVLTATGACQAPADWPHTPSLIAWASRVAIHVQPGPDAYTDLGREAGTVGRILVIEATPEHAPDWLTLAQQGHSPWEVSITPGLPA